MDITCLSKQCDSDSIHMIAKNFFDEIMLLYMLIDNCKKIQVNAESSNDASFTIIMNSKKAAETLSRSLSCGSSFIRYNKTYLISADFDDRNVFVKVTKAIS